MEQNPNTTRRRRNRNRNRNRTQQTQNSSNSINPVPVTQQPTQNRQTAQRQQPQQTTLSIFEDLTRLSVLRGNERSILRQRSNLSQQIVNNIENNRYDDLLDTNENDETSLMVAINIGNLNDGIIQALVNNQYIDIDYEEAINGNTALLLAIKRLKQNVALYLLEHGSDPELEDYTGENALYYARQKELDRVVEYILRQQTRQTRQTQQTQQTQQIQQPQQTRQPQQPTTQPLSIFADIHHIHRLYDIEEINIERQLIISRIRNNQYPDMNNTDSNGNTPLMVAILETHFEDGLIQAIVEHGNARIGHTNNNGETALICAISMEDENTALYLINTGQSNPDHDDNQGNNALYYANLDDLDRVVNALNNLNMAAAPIPESQPEQQPVVPDTDVNINLTGFNSITQERETIQNFLASDNNNVVFVVNNDIYFSNKNYIRTQLNNNINNKYGCKQAGDQMRFQLDSNINFTPIYFTLSAIAPLQIVIKKDEIESLLRSSNKLYICYNTTKILPAIISVAYHQGTTSGVSADHCQTGKTTPVYTLIPGNLVDIPINNAVAPVIQEQEQTVKVQYKGVTYTFPVTLETTLNDLKDMLLNKLVQENQIQTNNYNVKFIYTGKIYKDNDLNKKLVQLANPPFGITLQSMINPISGGKKSRKYNKSKLTKNKKYKQKTFKRKRKN